jgi:hypothetical protein
MNPFESSTCQNLENHNMEKIKKKRKNLKNVKFSDQQEFMGLWEYLGLHSLDYSK